MSLNTGTGSPLAVTAHDTSVPANGHTRTENNHFRLNGNLRPAGSHLPLREVTNRSSAALATVLPATETETVDLNCHGLDLSLEFKSVVVLSNRQIADINFRVDPASKVVHFELKVPVGGLTTALSKLTEKNSPFDCTFISAEYPGADDVIRGKASIDDFNRAVANDPTLSPGYKLGAIPTSEQERKTFYSKVANEVIWPIMHGLKSHFGTLDQGDWEVYKQVNEKFASAAVDKAKPGAMIWVHDYHMLCVPGMIREKSPDAIVSYFHHIPWPEPQTFRNFTPGQRSDVINGLLGADQIGFHTRMDVVKFLECVEAQQDSRITVVNPGSDSQPAMLDVDGRLIRVDAYPISVDYDGIKERVKNDPRVEEARLSALKRFQHLPEDHKIIFGVERLDYTKGLLERLEAIKLMLEEDTKGELIEKFTLMQHVARGRMDVPEYKKLYEDILKLAADINRKYGTPQWEPIQLSMKKLESYEVYGYARAADIHLVTPRADGMNLVAKEVVVANDVGAIKALILSNTCGAINELRGSQEKPGAYEVSPTAVSIKNAIVQVLDDLRTCPEQVGERQRNMDAVIKANHIGFWRDSIFGSLRRFRAYVGSLI